MNDVTLINRTDVPDKVIMHVVKNVCYGQNVPKFYLICQTQNHLGVTITNLDKPCVIIDVVNPNQFVKTLKHEIIHLKQHAQDYANEEECEEVELIVTDKHKTIYEQ